MDWKLQNFSSSMEQVLQYANFEIDIHKVLVTWENFHQNNEVSFKTNCGKFRVQFVLAAGWETSDEDLEREENWKVNRKCEENDKKTNKISWIAWKTVLKCYKVFLN